MNTKPINVTAQARKIAELVAETPIECRPALYRLVAAALESRTQGYQATLFRRIAEVA